MIDTLITRAKEPQRELELKVTNTPVLITSAISKYKENVTCCSHAHVFTFFYNVDLNTFRAGIHSVF